MSGYTPSEPASAYLHLEQQRWAAIRQLIEEMLAAIDPALVGGSLSPVGLPGGTLIDRGTWVSTALYRPGDLVVAADGMTYVAIAVSSNITPPNTAYWRPIGGSAVPPPPDTYVYLTDSDGNYLVDGDGVYLWEPA